MGVENMFKATVAALIIVAIFVFASLVTTKHRPSEGDDVTASEASEGETYEDAVTAY
jgi:hypothetical protein